MKTDTMPADIRQVIVRSLGAALAAAWRRQHETPTNDERPAPIPMATGRDVRGPGGREHHDDSSISA